LHRQPPLSVLGPQVHQPKPGRLRLAYGGSQEHFGLEPDLTILGKFIGGGVPVGAVAGAAEVMSSLDPYGPSPLFHGGSFNGNLLGMAAGTVAMTELTRERISSMDRTAARLADELPVLAARHSVPFSVSAYGSALGVYASETVPSSVAERTNHELWSLLHLVLINHGIYVGNEGEMATTTLIDNTVVDLTLEGFDAAFREVADQVA
jgi:glutamate-1-semialdehyde 2,1-aminomutase